MLQLLALADNITESNLDEGAAVAVGGIFAGLVIVWFLVIAVAIVFFVFWIFMIIDATQKTEAEYKKIGSGEKNLWIILLCVSWVFGLSWLAAILYYFMVKRKA